MHLEEMFFNKGNPCGEGKRVDTGNISKIGTGIHIHKWEKYC